MFFFPLGSCIGRLWEENTSFDRFIVERIVVSFFLCTTMLTDIVWGYGNRDRLGKGSRRPIGSRERIVAIPVGEN